MVPLSVLDLAPVVEGSDVPSALRNSLDLAQHVERWSYNRVWFAEHHNMPGIASAATAVLIAHVAAGTERIRVGAGGIMLPNHSPLVIAEQFGTLESLHPGRIDLGLGRAPGTDRATMLALRAHRWLEAPPAEPTARGRQTAPPAAALGSDTFAQDVQELQLLLGDPVERQRVRAIPGMGTHVPIWILGSSLYGAQLAAALGLPYAFASHFAPDALIPALAVYRERFRGERPYAMVACNVVCAETDEEARRLFTSQQQAWTNTVRGRRGRLPPPVDDIEPYWKPEEKAHTTRTLARSFVGSPATVRAGLQSFVEETAADELIVATAVHDHRARLRSYELLSSLR